ncbi:GerAB/ArcD/ProY family transporter [Paenibacillus senegalensis]|uniref:GerAB/ArcD/ProY family transporter n=1 Tax=Paenibacillus senegalensis TaxID=1465766 RepID=UPI000289E953|nr:endospore germination permease [Paenibacillus senegalensis]
MEKQRNNLDGTTPPNHESKSPKFAFNEVQNSSILASTAIGVGVLTLPRTAVEGGINEAGWLTPIWGGLFSILALYFISKLTLRFQGESITEYLPRIIGSERYPWIGRVLSFPVSLIIILLWLLVSGIAARIFGEVVSTMLLPRTPLEVIIILILLVSYMFVTHDIEVLARVNEFMLILILFPVLIISLSSFKSAKLDHLLPLFDVDWGLILKATLGSATSYIGIELLLAFSDRLTPRPSKLVKYNIFGVSIPIFTYTLITVAGISVFGVHELNLLTWPTLELVKTIDVPGAVLERVESLFLAVWVFAVFTTVGNYYFASVTTVMKVFKVSSQRWVGLLLLPFIYSISMSIPNLKRLFEFQAMIGRTVGLFFFILPIILLFIAVIRGKKITVHPDEASSQQFDQSKD